MLAFVTLPVIVLFFFGLIVFLDSQGPLTSSFSEFVLSPLLPFVIHAFSPSIARTGQNIELNDIF